MKRIPYGRHFVSDEDIAAMTEVLKSDFLTQGPKVEIFEQSFANYIGSKYAVAVSNGTAALHISALSLGIKPGDKVITTPITFAASANCVRFCNGDIDFVDIDPETYLMDLNKLEDKLKKQSPGTYKGIIPVDFAGYPIDLEELRKIADKYGLWILEDSCHAPGGSFITSRNEVSNCGSCEYSELAIFSFHPVKHITTGEGGMVTTNDQELYTKLKLFRTHGITKQEDLLSQNPGGWYYEMLELGYNYRMTDIQAALGISQLKRAEQNIQRRIEIAVRYDREFAGSSLRLQNRRPGFKNAFHLYVIQVDDRKGLYNFLQEKQIFSQVHYIPVHLLPYYQRLGWKKGDFPIAEEYYEHCLSLPMYPTLTDDEQSYVIDSVKEFLQR